MIELLTRSLHNEIDAGAPMPAIFETAATHTAVDPNAELTTIVQHARALNLDVPPDSSLHQLRGIAAGGIPMTKDEVRELITDYLLEKYS